MMATLLKSAPIRSKYLDTLFVGAVAASISSTSRKRLFHGKGGWMLDVESEAVLRSGQCCGMK